MKKIKYIILILILILILCITAIVVINKKNEKNYGEKDTLVSEHPTYVINEDIEKLSNRNQYYILLDCIKEFVNYTNNKNTNAVEAVTMQKNIQNIIDEYTFKDVDDISLEEIYVLNGYTYCTYYIKGKESIELDKRFYMMANLDFENTTYKLTPITENEYNKLITENKSKSDELTISKNKYNLFKNINVTNEDMARNYFNDYINKALNYPELAYNLLDEEYKNKRFGNLEEYKNNMSENENQMENTTMVKYGVNEKDNYTEYIIVDNFDNYYTIKENGIMDYTILLDNYTIKTEEFITTYNKASDAKKVATDIEIFIKMINNKDYKNAYECLSSEFKQNYFKTIDEFKNYVQKNFYDTNYITIKNVQTKSNVYTCTANIKSGVGVAADDMDKNFIIKLNPNAEFELSFEVE